MRCVTRIAGCSVALLLIGCAHRGGVASARDSVAAEFVGSSPGGVLAREFLGGLASNAECHSISWQITLFTNQTTGLPATYKLAALYHVPTAANPNRSQDGPKVASQGTWEIIKGAASGSRAAVYRVNAEKPRRSISFVRINESLLHLLNEDGSLAVGNGGQSYTLNRADHAETPGDMSQVNDAPEISYKISPLATGPTVFGVFEGRTPCQGIARGLRQSPHAGCIKAKWRVTLYKNPETSTPTAYKMEGSLFREGPREGSWSIVRGAKTDANATVYRLDATQTQPALFLLKADNDVLFFLNQNREPMVGHADFSYTLNRVTRK
jgi:hypothetical protein